MMMMSKPSFAHDNSANVFMSYSMRSSSTSFLITGGGAMISYHGLEGDIVVSMNPPTSSKSSMALS